MSGKSAVCSVYPGINQLPARQRGAALILALVVFAIVALLAASLSMDFLVSVKRVENQLNSQQAAAYMRGAEGIARKMLLEDMNSGGNIVHSSNPDLLLGKPVPFLLENGGEIIGTLCDLQGRFNLNNLPGGSTTPGAAPVRTDDQERFIRLLQALPLDSPLDVVAATEIADAVIDWIDSDNNVTGLGGAEDNYYSRLEPPYRAANQSIQSVSELRWVKGVSEELFRVLEPHVNALPAGVAINLNTAGLEILQSIGESGNLQLISPQQAGNVGTDRDEGTVNSPGFQSPQEITQAYTNQSVLAPVLANTAVSSDYFLMNIELLFQDRVYYQQAILHRDGGAGAVKVKTIARSQAGLGSCL